jgi:hypothetical protein
MIDFRSFLAHRTEIEGGDINHYPGSDEIQSISASFAARFGLMRLGIHHERIPPGRRVSWPHAEADEEEFVYVIEGEQDLWAEDTSSGSSPTPALRFRRAPDLPTPSSTSGCRSSAKPRGGEAVSITRFIPDATRRYQTQRGDRRTALDNRPPAPAWSA